MILDNKRDQFSINIASVIYILNEESKISEGKIHLQA